MCGFIGFIEKNTRQKKDRSQDIHVMLEKIKHRGPDGQSVYVGNDITLGFARLAFIDIAHSNQPMWDNKKTKVLTFNGEIYNYTDLRSELMSLGYVFTTLGDSEVLIHGYDAWGDALPTKLCGMFAFAIWDTRQETLFLARDHFGIKPLYYYQNEHVYMWGSEIKSFLPHPLFKKEFDTSLLHPYLSFSTVPGEKTFFKNVKKLQPGHTLLWHKKTNNTEIKQYFEVQFEQENTQTQSFESYVQEIENVVRESVKIHLTSEVPVGSLLSGGVDSAYVAAEASKIVPLQTFTLGFADKKYSEADDAKYVADLLNVKNTEIQVTPESFIQNAKHVQYHMDEPLANPSAGLLFELFAGVRKDVKAVLSGEGSDEMFCGYNVYQEPLALKTYTYIPFTIRRMLRNIVKSLPSFYGKNFIIRGGETIEERYVGNSNIFPLHEQYSILKTEFVNTSFNTSTYTLPIYQKIKTSVSDTTKMQFLDIHFWMVHEILQKADKMSMAHSVELRVPLLDIAIWNIGKRIPDSYKIDTKTTKKVFRAAAEKVLDTISSKRKKRAFPSPLPEWSRSSEYVQEFTQKFTSKTSNLFFNQTELIKLLDEHLSAKKNNLRKLWTIYCFIIWYEAFFINA